MNEEEDEPDEKWVAQFEDEIAHYQHFYVDAIKQIECQYIYIDKSNTITTLNKERLPLKTPNKLEKQELLNLINQHKTVNKIHYFLKQLYTYNISCTENSIINVLKQSEDPDYFKVNTTLNDIEIKPGIEMFKNLNTIYFLFYENEKKLNNKTKKLKKQMHKKTARVAIET